MTSDRRREQQREYTRAYRARNPEKARESGRATDARRTPEQRAWRAMRTRCLNPNASNYAYYGGRGIEIRFDSFEAFLADIGPKPGPEYTVERVDNDGHYEPGNVRWATKSEQAKNRRIWQHAA